jgi:cbb3-type cytochrome oxidase subunit 3
MNITFEIVFFWLLVILTLLLIMYILYNYITDTTKIDRLMNSL